MSAANAVHLTAGAVALMVLVLALIAVMVLLDGIAAAPVRPKPRHRRSPGVQFFAYDAGTTPIVILRDGRTVR